MDAPVTLSRLAKGEHVAYVPVDGYASYDLTLSYTGGIALDLLKERLGAKHTAPLYGCVDPHTHAPTRPEAQYGALLSHLGAYAEDRRDVLHDLFLEPASRMAEETFLIGGSLYPEDFPRLPNIRFARHVPPSEHRRFFSSSRFTLNITRGAMAEMGYCPSGRIFEAAACGAPIISDSWAGLEMFLEPGKEIILACNADEVIRALRMPEDKRRSLVEAAKERVLAEHTAYHRALALESLLGSSLTSRGAYAGASVRPGS